MHDRIVSIGGKRWRWKWHHFGRQKVDGDCDPPETTGKSIRVRRSLARKERQYRLLEVATHETLHALHWGLSEDTVTQGAEDVAAILWKLGYRRIHE